MERVLLTGATGFLGKYIKLELESISKVLTISRRDGDIKADLVNTIPNLPVVDVVVHCAGKAHSVPKTSQERSVFLSVNVTGTENLLKGLSLSQILPKSFIYISSVAVYGSDYGILINEDTPLNAKDIYGQSKIQAEQLVQAWCSNHNVICSILRLPLLVGINPPGNLGDMINGIRKGYYFNIGSGESRKSMVLASDVARLIPIVSKIGGLYNLTDGYHPSFNELSELISKQLNKRKPYHISLRFSKIIARIGDLLGSNMPINSRKLRKITSELTFDDTKARIHLNWNPMKVLDKFNIK